MTKQTRINHLRNYDYVKRLNKQTSKQNHANKIKNI